MIMIGVLCALELVAGSTEAAVRAITDDEEPVILPREVADHLTDMLSDRTVENPLSEHTTCGEFTAVDQMLEVLEAAKVRYATQARGFQREGHAKSYVCSNTHRE